MGLVLLIAGVVYLFGVDGALWLLLGITLATQYELYRLFERMELKTDKILGIICGGLIILGSYYMVDLDKPRTLDAGNDVFAFCFIGLTLTVVGKNFFAGRIRSFLPTLFGLVLVPYMMHFLVRLVRTVEFVGLSEAVAMVMVAWLVAVAKLTDVGGLLVGISLGHIKLAPNLSPKKTIEGAVGGVALAVGASVLMAYYMPPHLLPPNFTPLMAALLSAPIALVAMFSDLLESAIKRTANVKDSGRFVPGIGGAFDLTDSLILSAPFGYLLIKYALL